MLTIYRRHKIACKHRAEGREYRRCGCPIWIDGTDGGGRQIRATLNTRDWDQAEKIRSDRSVNPAAPTTTIVNAWDAFLADMAARKLSCATIGKYHLLRRTMMTFATDLRLSKLSNFDLDACSRFRATWTDGTRSSSKKLERLRAFFKFCLARKWTESNPATELRLPKIVPCPTMPLTHEDFVRVITACDNHRITTPPSGKLCAHRLRTLILLMRYTGLRISDAVSLTTDRVDGNKIFLYTAKTSVPVYTIVPTSVVTALEETPRVSDTRYFWSGQGKRETAVCDYQGRIKKIFDAAGIVKGLSNAVSHRLRDSFAVELLLAGVPIERVSVLLGHQSIRITEKHYSPWTSSRQDQIERDLAAVWKTDPSLQELSSGQTKGTYPVHEKKTSAIN